MYCHTSPWFSCTESPYSTRSFAQAQIHSGSSGAKKRITLNTRVSTSAAVVALKKMVAYTAAEVAVADTYGRSLRNLCLEVADQSPWRRMTSRGTVATQIAQEPYTAAD